MFLVELVWVQLFDLNVTFKPNIMCIFFTLRLTGREKRVGGFDLMWNDGPVYMDDTSGADCIPNPPYPTNTFLGEMSCYCCLEALCKLTV